MYQMTIKYVHIPFERKIGKTALKNANIFHCKSFQNLPKLRFLVCKYTIWQHCNVCRIGPSLWDGWLVDQCWKLQQVCKPSNLKKPSTKQRSPTPSLLCYCHTWGRFNQPVSAVIYWRIFRKVKCVYTYKSCLAFRTSVSKIFILICQMNCTYYFFSEKSS
jgi:hypothetical protein